MLCGAASDSEKIVISLLTFGSCWEEVGKAGGRGGNQPTLKISIQRGFERSFMVHSPVIEIFYSLLKDHIRT